MKKTFLKISIPVLALSLFPFSNTQTTYSSSGIVSDQNISESVEKFRSINPVFDGPGTETISKSIHFDYNVGASYPTSRYYEEYHSQYGWIGGTMYVSDVYWIGNGKVRVWYHGNLS